MKFLRLFAPVLLSFGLASCHGNSTNPGDEGSRLSSLTIGDFRPAVGSSQSDWVRSTVSLAPNQTNLSRIVRSFDKIPGSPMKDGTVMVPYGTYKIRLMYTDAKGVTLYESCTSEQGREHQIQMPRYVVEIKICRVGTSDPAGTVVTGNSEVEINPVLSAEQGNMPNPSPTPGTNPASGKFVDRHGFLQAQGNRIVNKDKQPIQLRGMSLFWSHWSADFWNRQLVTSQARDWKATLIRAAMGVEEGGYLTNPQAEKDRVKTIVEQAIAEGIYVIIDWHDHNASAHRDQAIGFFSEMASLYGQTPNVIFEIYNEPINQSWEEVKSYSEAVIGAIRSKGARNLVIVGSPTWSQRVDLAADNPIRDSNVAYTLHFYANSHRQELRDKAEYALNKGIPLFVTEFGVCDASGNGGIDLAETDRWMQFMDRHQISWANWSLFDKPESASALKPGASRTGPWNNDALTTSGEYIRRKIGEGQR